MNALGIPELSEKEMAKHVEEEDFFLKYGNPVLVTADNGESVVMMSMALYNRFVGLTKKAVDLKKE